MPDRNSGDKFGVYIHVPFCHAPRCAYCDFYSTPEEPGRIGRWLAGVKTECRSAVDRFGADWNAESVFFGGGTPSLLAPKQLNELFAVVREYWPLAPDAEVTAECNPEDVDRTWSEGAMAAGINRLSLGVQSFDAGYLAAIGRCHRPGQAEKALIAAREAGFERISADLILGGPGSNVEIILAGVERAIGLGVEHLSVYGYHLDPPAAGFGQKRYSPVDDDLWGEQYLAVCNRLASEGWRHYEISNWARDDSALCAHNLYYWRRMPYLGLGPSAHSCGPGELRLFNRPDLDAWLAAAEAGDFSAVRESETLDGATVLFECVMLGLRLDTGVELELLERIHGPQVSGRLKSLVNQGYAVMADGRLSLTGEGFLIYDSLAVELAPEVEQAG